MKKRHQSGSQESHTIQSLTSLESAQTSTPHPRPLTPQQGRSSARWVNRVSADGAIAFPQADAIWKGKLNPRKMASVVL